MKHEEHVCPSAMSKQLSLIRIALVRRMRPRKARPHHSHHRRHGYSTFMMENMSARSIF